MNISGVVPSPGRARGARAGPLPGGRGSVRARVWGRSVGIGQRPRAGRQPRARTEPRPPGRDRPVRRHGQRPLAGRQPRARAEPRPPGEGPPDPCPNIHAIAARRPWNDPVQWTDDDPTSSIEPLVTPIASTIDQATGSAGPRPAPGRPELLAPAGDRTCLIAAVENGADAVYFGLQRHNARARAANFDARRAARGRWRLLHRRGRPRATSRSTPWSSPASWPTSRRLVRQVAEAGVDAVIVQDLGLARLIRAICPDLEIHASTQMSITSAESMRLAAGARLLAGDPRPGALARRDRPGPRTSRRCPSRSSSTGPSAWPTRASA